MNLVLIVLVAVAVGLLVFYFIFAESFVNSVIRLMRRASRLKRKTVVVAGESWPCL